VLLVNSTVLFLCSRSVDSFFSCITLALITTLINSVLFVEKIDGESEVSIGHSYSPTLDALIIGGLEVC
jgi:hypothetical protein